MAYENIMNGQPLNLYQQKKREREIFEANEKQRELLAQRQQAQSLSQQKPTEIPSIGGLLGGVKETVGGWFDPETLSKAEYDKAKSGSRNPFITLNEEIVTDYSPTSGSPPKNPPRSADGTIIGDAPAGQIDYTGVGKTEAVQDNRTSVNPHGNPNDGGMGVKKGSHTEYTKSIDKSYMAALISSAIPDRKPTPTPRLLGGGGAHGGGENLGNVQEYASGERRKKKNPSLWRYS